MISEMSANCQISLLPPRQHVTATIPKNSACLGNDFTIPHDSVEHYDKYHSVIVYNIRGKIAEL